MFISRLFKKKSSKSSSGKAKKAMQQAQDDPPKENVLPCQKKPRIAVDFEVDFGTILITDAPVEKQFMVKSKGEADLNVQSIRAVDDFTVTDPSPFSLPPGQTKQIKAKFTPTRSGVLKALVYVSSDASNSVLCPVRVQGEALEPLIQLNDSKDFGEVFAGTATSDYTVTIANPGYGTLTVSSIALSNTTDFTATLPQLPLQIEPDTPASFPVKMKQTKVGDFTTTVTVKSDAVRDNDPTLEIKGKVVSWVEFQVVDDAGKPISGATVRYQEENAAAAELTTADDGVVRVKAAADGKFKLLEILTDELSQVDKIESKAGA
jgi:flagellin-like hook-associated protein FlgL